MFIGEMTSSPKGLVGLGPKALKDLHTLGIRSLGQLLLHFPRDYEDHQKKISLLEGVQKSQPVNTQGRITHHSHFPLKGKSTLKIHILDEKGEPGVLICFNRPFLAQAFPPNKEIWVYGDFQYRFSEIQSSSFQLTPYEGQPPKEFGGLLPLYPLSGSLSQPQMRRAVAQALAQCKGLEEDLPESWIKEKKFPPLMACLRSLHFPKSKEELHKGRERYAFGELVHLQFALLQGRAPAPRRPTQNLETTLISRARESLPFTLTSDQEGAIAQILEDLGSTRAMGRLLQGDVGSGKTLVAFLTALPIIALGAQVALMAPTELLALQHAQKAAQLLEPLGVRVAYLSGNIQAGARPHLLRALAQGEVDLVLGTHALFSQDVVYKNLQYIIVDEQHRFGVGQRQEIAKKGANPHMLLMSATPIPRTLALSAYGDLDLSTIKQLPPGRIPIKTHLSLQSKIKKVEDFVKGEISKGHQAYWVLPLIEATGKSDLKDAVSQFHHLQSKVFPQVPMGLLHSKVEEEEKKRTMEAFVQGKIQILVATSVVEVGVDVPMATCMVIEHAERFGLSALHQLRGRVGRKDLPSYCFLVYREGLTEEAKSRLLVMKESQDGFLIAEKDLALRGPGELTGTRQSGFLRLRVADLMKDGALLEEAREKVLGLLKNPKEQKGLKVLQELFHRAAPFSQDLVQQI